jgi:hypothetical protein
VPLDKKLYSVAAACVLVVSLAGCGGGGGGTSGALLEGRWSGSAVLTSTAGDCGPIAGTRALTYDVSVSGESVKVLRDGQVELTGTLTSAASLEAQFLAVSAQVDIIERMVISEATTAQAQLAISTVERTADKSCAREWRGTIVRPASP